MINLMEEFHKIEDIIEKLIELDYYCDNRNTTAKLVILGGSGILINLAQNKAKFRPTKDIDIDTITASNWEQFEEALKEANIHTVGGVIDVPPREDLIDERNLFKLETDGFTNIEVYVPTLELLACCKIFSKREKDLNDLRNTDLLVKCNKNDVLSLVEYYSQYTFAVDDPELNLHELENIFREKGI